MCAFAVVTILKEFGPIGVLAQVPGHTLGQ